MGGCGFNAACQLHAIVAPWWTFLVWGFWIVVALVALWALSKLKEVGGWPAVAAAVGAGLAGAGYVAGRRSVRVAGTAPSRQQLSVEQTKALQRALAAKHLYPGAIDGKFGAKTEAGLLAFQRSRGEPATGRPTLEQLRALGINIPRQ